MMTIDRAGIDDLADVLAVLNSAADQLHARGLDQWPTGFGAERVGPYVARAEMWLVRDDSGKAVATARATGYADPDFWTPAESRDLALYVEKLARAPQAPAGAGTLLLRWITDKAASLGYSWVRLDAWRTNTGLHRYYLDRGWTYLRTVEAPGRRSGALFQRPAAADPEAVAAFSPPLSAWLAPGTRVNVANRGQQETGTITALYSPAGLGEVPDPGDYGILPGAGYWVQLDGGGAVLCLPEEVTPQPLATSAP